MLFVEPAENDSDEDDEDDDDDVDDEACGFENTCLMN